MKSSRTEAPTGRIQFFLCDPSRCVGLFWAFAGLGFCFVRAGNAFWSLLLQLAAQVLAPGVGDVAPA